jgi:flagellar basal body-associated protein FliL
MPDQKDAKSAESATAKKKPPLMMIIAIVALVAIIGGAVVGKTVFAKSKSGTQKKKADPGAIVPLDEFLVNLADPSGDHFLKVTVNLEFTKVSGKTAESLKEQIPPIRDAVLTALCSKTRDQIMPLSGREELKTDIRKDVNTALGEQDVENVYFSDFVTQ